MSSTRSDNLYIWLHGTPIFSLSYSTSLPGSTGNLCNPTDITGYRPDPRDLLERGKKYKVVGKFTRETTGNGDDIWILKQIYMDGVLKFVYIR